MRRYLSTLHTRSDRHKKHFALAFSSAATLSIFAFWALATFGTGGTLAQKDIESRRAHPEVSPLSSLKDNLSASLGGLNSAFDSVKNTLKESVDLEADYLDMKEGVLNTYGQ